MKKQNKRWMARLASFALAGVCLCGGALAAGDKDDPLITLSYLTKTATPEILEQVEQQAEEHQTKLLEKFNAAIDEYKALIQKEKEEQQESQLSAAYTVVTLAKGQKLNLGVGCEVMLRVGGASVSAATAPALVDVSSGGSLNDGQALETNHLYMATIADRSITASTDTVKVLVRGEYTVI